MREGRDVLAEAMVQFRHDPCGFVTFAFPWDEEGGRKGTSGPVAWQREVLEEIGHDIGATGTSRIAVASGHGIGKSALVSWLVLWALSTMADTRVVVTANTENQLRTKTWPEIAKWHRLMINANWFRLNATSLVSVDPAHTRLWRADAVPWSEHNTEAFAGLHNAGKRVLLVMDEASAIADSIWDVAEGAMTDRDTEIVWTAFGNPTKPSGRFRECFAGGRFAHRWTSRQIDSRTVETTNKQQLDAWIEDYGEASDFVKVRIRGLFPDSSAVQFIDTDCVRHAMRRAPSSTPYDPLIMGVDVARFGDDRSVIAWRRGRDAQSLPVQAFRGLDTMQLAAQVAAEINARKPGAVFIDGGGVGGGVIDRLAQLGHRVIGVNFGGKAEDSRLYANKRAEMWGRLREWLAGGSLADHPALAAELTGPEYAYDKDSRLVLEKKADMKKRGLASPDHADALALTFAHPVAPLGAAFGGADRALTDFDPYDY